jgi:hypothetical protein
MAMYLPVPYQRRLSFGIQPAIAILAANALVAVGALLRPRPAGLLRQIVVVAASSGTLLVLVSVVASAFANAPLPIYRSTRDLDAAADWLDTQARSDQVILADWQASNYLAPRTSARVFGGHPVATLHAQEKQFAVENVFAHTSSLAVARALKADWLVYGPDEASLEAPPASPPAFQSGAVRIYRVDQ